MHVRGPIVVRVRVVSFFHVAHEVLLEDDGAVGKKVKNLILLFS